METWHAEPGGWQTETELMEVEQPMRPPVLMDWDGTRGEKGRNTAEDPEFCKVEPEE